MSRNGATLSRRACVWGIAALPSAAAEFWARKPYEGWDQDEVRRMLTDSPWARTFVLPLKLEEPPDRGPITYKDIPGAGPGLPANTPGKLGESPVGGLGAPRPTVPREAQVIVRWMNALPVRQALALHKFGAQGIAAPEARQRIEQAEPFYVLEVLGIPSLVAFQGPELLQTRLYRSSALITKKGRSIRPESAYVAVQGLFLGITIRFPRTEPLTESEGFVDFVGNAGLFEISRRFDLRRMGYRGRLEL